MGFEYEDMRLILEASHQLDRKDRLLVLGDAVVHFTGRDLERLARETNTPLATSVGALSRLDSFSLGRAMGFQTTQTLDINGKASLTVDLQETLPSELKGAFDCVIDAGVLFWCFEPGLALMNVYRMLRPGGLAVHITAASGHYGRGYYNIHPLLLEDFYLHNGSRFLLSALRTKFAAPEPLRTMLGLLGFRNRVTRSERPGSVYLRESRINRIRFGPSKHAPREANWIPNNVIAIVAFKKELDADPVSPQRSTPYEVANG